MLYKSSFSILFPDFHSRQASLNPPGGLNVLMYEAAYIFWETKNLKNEVDGG